MRLRVGDRTPACARDGLTGCRCRDRRKQLGHLADGCLLSQAPPLSHCMVFFKRSRLFQPCLGREAAEQRLEAEGGLVLHLGHFREEIVRPFDARSGSPRSTSAPTAPWRIGVCGRTSATTHPTESASTLTERPGTPTSATGAAYASARAARSWIACNSTPGVVSLEGQSPRCTKVIGVSNR